MGDALELPGIPEIFEGLLSFWGNLDFLCGMIGSGHLIGWKIFSTVPGNLR